VQSQGNPSYPNHHHAIPKPHAGPFNAKCLFMENADSLMRRIADFLRQQNVRYV